MLTSVFAKGEIKEKEKKEEKSLFLSFFLVVCKYTNFFAAGDCYVNIMLD